MSLFSPTIDFFHNTYIFIIKEAKKTYTIKTFCVYMQKERTPGEVAVHF